MSTNDTINISEFVETIKQDIEKINNDIENINYDTKTQCHVINRRPCWVMHFSKYKFLVDFRNFVMHFKNIDSSIDIAKVHYKDFEIILSKKICSINDKCMFHDGSNKQHNCKILNNDYDELMQLRYYDKNGILDLCEIFTTEHTDLIQGSQIGQISLSQHLGAMGFDLINQSTHIKDYQSIINRKLQITQAIQGTVFEVVRNNIIEQLKDILDNTVRNKKIFDVHTQEWAKGNSGIKYPPKYKKYTEEQKDLAIELLPLFYSSDEKRTIIDTSDTIPTTPTA